MAFRRLKEQDDVIDLVRHEIERLAVGKGEDEPFAMEAGFERVQNLICEHRKDEANSELARTCRHRGTFFHDLDLVGALREYDISTGITKRSHALPSFKECREIFNLATIRSIAPTLRMVTLDADETVYEDGGKLTIDSPMIPLICKLLRLGLHVSFVTAASYPGEPSKYEMRLAGLLSALAFVIECGAPASILSRFHVMGGQSNFLLQAKVDMPADGLSPRVYLEEVSPQVWKDYRGVRWDHGDIAKLLDTAEESLRTAAAALNLDVLVVRKERAVGIVARSPASAHRLTYEVLEECALATQIAIEKGYRQGKWSSDVPHCAFNGGHDVFVDIGHKALGIRALQGLFGIEPSQTVHAGDRFTRTGNDLRAREIANTLWVGGPHETEYLLTLLIEDIRKHRNNGSAAWGIARDPVTGAVVPAALPAPTVLVPAPSFVSVMPRIPSSSSSVSSHTSELVRMPTPKLSPIGSSGPVDLPALTLSQSASSTNAPDGLSINIPPAEPAASSTQALSPSVSAPLSMRGRGIASSADGVVTDAYGITAARAAMESETRHLSALRSAWESAGGVVVAEVVSHRHKPEDAVSPSASASKSQ
jgi:IMP and pyridine-specific 5'-nucleotidase